MNEDQRPDTFEDAQYWVMVRSVEGGPSDTIGLSHQYRTESSAAREAESYVREFRRKHPDVIKPDDTVHWNVIPVTEMEFHAILQDDPTNDPTALAQTWLGKDGETKNPPQQTLQTTIKLPEPWKDLVETEFDPDDRPPKLTERNGLGDPDPYVDDHRIVGAELPDGRDLSVTLASGNENYWATMQVHEHGELLYQTQPFHEFSDTMPIHTEDTTYQVDIDWTSPQPEIEDEPSSEPNDSHERMKP